MKKRIAGAVAVATAALATWVAPAGATVDSSGKPCSELLRGTGAYTLGSTPVAPRTVTADVELAATPCDKVTYALTVTYTTLSGAAVTQRTTAYTLVGGTTISLAVAVPEPDAPDQVSATVSTISKKGDVLDETNTVLSLLDGGGGGSFQG